MSEVGEVHYFVNLELHRVGEFPSRVSLLPLFNVTPVRHSRGASRCERTAAGCLEGFQT